MHNPTPLGTMMHFKELDRQAGPELRPLPDGRWTAYRAITVTAAIAAQLPRLLAFSAPGRMLKQD